MYYFFFQSLILFTSSLLILSHESSTNKVYNESEKPGSCKEILENYPATPSGYYFIQPPSTVQVYCDMENEQCGSKGWTRVALIDRSNRVQSCPGNLTLISSPIRTRGGPTGRGIGCTSATYHIHEISYSQVCGRLRGYQVGAPNALGPYVNNGNPDLAMDGILISHGKAQKHIWAYATGYEKVVSSSTIDAAVYN